MDRPRVRDRVAEHLDGAVGQRRMDQEARHQVDSLERGRRRDAGHPQSPDRERVATPVERLVADRLLVRDALTVDADRGEVRDPSGRKSSPVGASDHASDLEQPDRLVQGVVADAHVEPGIGELRAVPDQEPAEPGRGPIGTDGDERGPSAGQAREPDGPHRGRVIVPAVGRRRPRRDVVARPVPNQRDRSRDEPRVAGRGRGRDQVLDGFEAVQPEHPVRIVERVLAPCQVVGQADGRKGSDRVPVLEHEARAAQRPAGRRTEGWAGGIGRAGRAWLWRTDRGVDDGRRRSRVARQGRQQRDRQRGDELGRTSRMTTTPGAMERSHHSPSRCDGERGVRRRSSGRVTVGEEERPPHRASRSQPGAG